MSCPLPQICMKFTMSRVYDPTLPKTATTAAEAATATTQNNKTLKFSSVVATTSFLPHHNKGRRKEQQQQQQHHITAVVVHSKKKYSTQNFVQGENSDKTQKMCRWCGLLKPVYLFHRCYFYLLAFLFFMGKGENR